jgi:hypothetical protein
MKRREGPQPIRAISDDGSDEDGDDATPRPMHDPLQTSEIDGARDRRVTVMSGIPAIMAESMGHALFPGGRPRDPAAPLPSKPEHTRRVGDSGHAKVGSGASWLAQGDADVAPWRKRAAQHIDSARAALDAGDVTAAVTAAEAAMREGEEAPPPGIVEVIEPARPLLTRVFAAYVGPSSGLPVLAPRAAEIAASRLGPRERALLDRVDGTRTLEELFDGSGLGSTDALRVAARLLRVGAVRIV